MRKFRKKNALTYEEALTVLNIPKGVSLSEIKSRYRTLAKEKHPDTFPEKEREKAEQEFKWIALAKDILLGNLQPGYPELDKTNFKTPRRFYLNDLEIKKFVISAAKKVGGKPVKRSNYKNTYAIRFSDYVGVSLQFLSPTKPYHKSQLLKFRFVSLGPKKSWEPLFPQYEPIMQYPISDWILQILKFKKRYDKQEDFFEDKAGRPNPAKDKQILKHIKSIKSISGWDQNRILLQLMKILERGDDLKDIHRYQIKTIKRIFRLQASLKGRSATKQKHLEMYLNRLSRYKKLTKAQEENLKKWETGKKKKPKSKSSPNQDKLKKDLLKKLLLVHLTPDKKDFDRITVIMKKPNPIREAQIQSKKIRDPQKILRRAKAAYVFYKKNSNLKFLEVALIYMNRARDLGAI